MFPGRTETAIIYAFLRYSDSLSLLNIIAGLLDQLVRSHSIAFAHILPTYQHSKKYGDELSCSEAVEALRGILNLFADVFIIIDGLDEVDDATKGGLLRFIASIQAHVLITCRPLDHFKRHHTPHALHISVQAQTRDIDIYVAQRIQESAVLSEILSKNPAIAGMLSALVKEKSQGMFLLARLQMELVLERCTSVGSLLKAIETLPSGITDMYRSTMERINSQSEDRVSIAHRTLIWILHARRDLSPEELLHALTFSFDDLVFDENSLVSISVLLSICCGLIKVEGKEEEGPVVRFIHYSTQEFMKTLTFPHLPDPDNMLAVTNTACVDIHLTQIMRSLDPNDLFELYSHDQDHRVLLRYALPNWGHHARDCDELQKLDPFIRSFLSKRSNYILMGFQGHSGIGWQVSTGLHLAAAYGLDNLISSKALPYIPTHGTQTPFHLAAERGHATALVALLKHYSGVHVRDKDSKTPLHGADWEVAQILLNLSPSDNWRSFPSEIVDANARNSRGDSAFMLACRRLSSDGDERLPRLFISQPGIDPDLPSLSGETVLSVCLSEPYTSFSDRRDTISQLLISSFPNIDVDTENRRGETSFMHACDSSSLAMVTWFLSRNRESDPDFIHQEDWRGRNALERLVEEPEYGSREELDGRQMIMELLTRHGGTVRVLHGKGESQTISSVCLNDNHRRYGNGRTSLMVMALSYHLALQYLISRNSQDPDFLNAQDNDGLSALMIASKEHVDFSVKLLTACSSIDIHLRDRTGKSALVHVLEHNNVEAMAILLDHASWNLKSIRKAVIAAAQSSISPDMLNKLLGAKEVQQAFSWRLDAGDSADVIVLLAMLRRRPNGCKGILAKVIGHLPINRTNREW
ncbi:ankyrin repeat-containing domain protein [Ephemerocybe angulata]|uniref:Ankyrin repeat-containing domain protein n=1 Tax=Ephemerocybe angulata TaxID=980116 RepID=A0A8H6HZI4_9AGAR|nr:ankyrin repeat-containing domain protein [Tulosesus angulatus]